MSQIVCYKLFVLSVHPNCNWPWNMLFYIKNPQFWPKQVFIQVILPTHGLEILTKFHNDLVKILDFLIIAYFWASCNLGLGATPSRSSKHIQKNGVWSLINHIKILHKTGFYKIKKYRKSPIQSKPIKSSWNRFPCH